VFQDLLSPLLAVFIATYSPVFAAFVVNWWNKIK